ncbi:MAG: OmpH family outer membrane protein [Brevinematia bacterium]
MRTKIFIVFLAILAIVITYQTYGYSKVEKIGIVDLTEVFDKFLEGKEIAKEFNEYKKYSEEKLESMRKEINDIRTKITQISNTINLSKETNIDPKTSTELYNLSKEYESKVENYINELRSVEEKLNKFRESLKQYVYKDLLNYIKSYGERNGFSIILDIRGNLIFYSKGNDVTQDINKWIKVQEDAKKKY